MNEEKTTLSDAAMEAENPSSERSYIAFISYRHSQLDREAAERVQKKIENYIVPKEFRDKVGGKKLGLCFRDEDELPASSSLTNSIYYALDHTQFLIVICTPNLPLSKWCEAEIRYFLKTHDRDHILAVLADGDPSESFSPYMLHTFDEEGNITGDTEPLAANIAGPNHTINNKAFKKEIVRLYAALIGCPFDELWQRERRARTNRLLSLAGAAVVVMAIFLGVVLNRNAKIEEQNTQILAQNDQITRQYDQIQEQNAKIEEQNIDLQTQLSSALVDSGLNKLKIHDVKGALEDGVNALENEDPAIYDHRAVKLLSDALCAYQNDVVQSTIVYEQSTPITDLAVTDDEEFAVFLDMGGTISCIDLDQFELKWQLITKDAGSTIYTKNLNDRIIYKSKTGVYCHSLNDGSVLWSYEHQERCENYMQAISEDGTVFAVADHFGENSYGPDNPVFIVFLDTQTGKELGRTDMTRERIEYSLSSVLYEPEDYASTFSTDNSLFACILHGEGTLKTDGSKMDVYSVNYISLDDFSKTEVGIFESKYEKFYGIDIRPKDKSLFFADYATSRGGIRTVLATKGKDEYEFSYELSDHDMRSSQLISFEDDAFKSNDCHFLSNGSEVLIFSDDDMFVFDRDENRLMRSYAMSDTITNAFWHDSKTDASKKYSFEVTMSDGNIAGYDLGTEYLFDYIYGIEQFDQNDMKFVQPLDGGMLINDESGRYLTVGGEGECLVLLARTVTDPHLETYSFDEITDYSYTSGVCFAADSDTAMYLYNGSDAFTFDTKTGSVLKNAHFEESFSLENTWLLDDDHFLVNDKCYAMDGTIESYGEPITFGEDPIYPSEHVRLEDGSVLSINKCSAFSLALEYGAEEFSAFGPYPSICLAWLDGKPLDPSADPKQSFLIVDDYMEGAAILTAGSNGLVFGYGKRIRLENDQLVTDADAQFHFYDPRSNTISSVENRFPDSGEFEIAMGNKKDMAAVLYSDGNVCIYRPDASAIRELEPIYGADEISAIAFSEEDDYLAVLTAVGRLDLYDTESFERIFSKTIDLYHTYYVSYDWIFNNISIRYSADRSRLIVMSDSASSKYTVILDPTTWHVEAELKSVYDYDPSSDRFFFQGTNQGIFTCPFYHMEDLKEWAISELAE